MSEKEKNEISKIKKQFWIGNGILWGIVGFVVLIFLVLSTLNFFG